MRDFDDNQPSIGPLLDEWELLPNDVVDMIAEDAPGLYREIMDLWKQLKEDWEEDND